MATTETKTVTFTATKPQLFVESSKVNDAVSFYKNAFGAEEVTRVNHPKRKADQDVPLVVSAQVKIGSLTVIVSDIVDATKKKHRSEVLSGAQDEFVTSEVDMVNNGESLSRNVEGIEQASSTPDEAEKVHLEAEVSNTEYREVSEDPSPVAANKEDNAWTVITTGGWNKWANNGFVVHGKGSALGPILKWLRSAKPDWLKEKT